MDTICLSRVVLIAAIAVVVQSLSVEEIAQRQSQVTMDIFQHFQEQLQTQESTIGERIRLLEARILAIESKPASEPEGGQTEPETETEPEPEPTLAPTTTVMTTAKATTLQVTTKRPTTEAPAESYEPTCAHIFQSGYTTSGDYTIDPDGFGDKRPFAVYCDMDLAEGTTVIGHNREEEGIVVNGFEDPGSYVLAPTYDNGVTILQLGALADASVRCTQYVKYSCKNSGLMEVHTKTGLTYAWWVDRYGQKRVNFGGATTDSGKCACAENEPNTCFEGTATCSCDHKKAKNTFDDGEFDDKDLLPVTSINLGDTGNKKERGAITLGKFMCSGAL